MQLILCVIGFVGRYRFSEFLFVTIYKIRGFSKKLILRLSNKSNKFTGRKTEKSPLGEAGFFLERLLNRAGNTIRRRRVRQVTTP